MPWTTPTTLAIKATLGSETRRFRLARQSTMIQLLQTVENIFADTGTFSTSVVELQRRGVLLELYTPSTPANTVTSRYLALLQKTRRMACV